MNKISSINSKGNLNFLKSSAKINNDNKQQVQNANKTKKLTVALIGLGTIGIALLLVANSKKPNIAHNDEIKKLSVTFKNAIAYSEKGEPYSGELVKTNSLGEKFNIQLKDGLIKQSTKTMPDGSISWIKKYSKNDYGQKVVDIFTPKDDGEIELTKKVLTSKDKIAIFKGENTVEHCWFNTPTGWRRIDDFIDKSNVKNYQTPKEYYTYNGIQINSFLRDGEFRHPNDCVDRIHYEYLDDPECPKYIKDDIRKIMKDNRFILDTIDGLDKLTQTSKTQTPMTVYRNAPKWWINKAVNGILEENAFCSTSTEKNASMEGLYVGKHAKDGVTYTIHLPKGTPYFDLTASNEKEMLLPRKGHFRVINDTELEYIL